MTEKKTWEEFRSSGLLWFINSILHAFGWAIAIERNGDEEIVYPARVKYRGFSEASNTNGYYKFLTKTMSTYEDFNISLYITNEYSATANGIFQIHVRNTNSTTTTPAPSVFNWLIRRNWAEDSIIAVVNGLTIDFYLKQTYKNIISLNFIYKQIK